MTSILSDQCLGHSMPDSDDFEISLFGPGFGECLAIHLPGGKWLLVDSCRGEDGRPASLAYLRAMGIHIDIDVAMVVASHWHWDHVDGIAELVEECRSAEPVISAALYTRDLLAYAGAVQYLGATAPRAIVELRRLADAVSNAKPPRYITTTQARMRLLESTYAGLVTSVEALSPSPASVALAVRDLSRSSLQAGREVIAPRADYNSAALVLRIRSGNIGLLLTSDLETLSDPARGWRAVVELSGDQPRCQVVKVAHHGSVNGDDAIIWESLAEEMPLGIVTHFHNGSVHLPEADRLEIIKDRCSGLFSTSGPAWKPSAVNAETMAKLIADGLPLASFPVGLGHIRARIKPDREMSWRLSVCGPAAAIVPRVSPGSVHAAHA